MSAAGNCYNRRPILQWRCGHDRAEEQALVEQLVAHAAVETLDIAILHRSSRRDVVPLDLVIL